VLPGGKVPTGPRALPGDRILPDAVAFADDLTHVAEILASDALGARAYVAQLLSGVAVSAHDPALAAAAGQLALTGGDMALRRVVQLVEQRLSRAQAV
jgi:hypothetical protein